MKYRRMTLMQQSHRMLKMAVQQGRSERRGEEVRTALRGAVCPLNSSWQTEKLLTCFGSPRKFVSALSL